MAKQGTAHFGLSKLLLVCDPLNVLLCCTTIENLVLCLEQILLQGCFPWFIVLLILVCVFADCEDYHFLHEGLCVSGCPGGFFESTDQMECLRCHTDCALCTGPSSDDCRACVDPEATLNNGECAESCPSHHYRDPLTGGCVGRCRTCDLSYHYCLLMPSFFSHFIPECDESCLTCAGPSANSCTSCAQDRRLDGLGRCARPASACSPHQYSDLDGECHPCHKHCLGCWGPSKSQCLSCTQRHLLFSESRFHTRIIHKRSVNRPGESPPRLHAHRMRPLPQMAPARHNARRAITRMSQSRSARRATLPVSRASEGAATSASSVKPVCFERPNNAWRPASAGWLTSSLSLRSPSIT